MKLYDFAQNSQEWIEFKLGKFSASTAYDLMLSPQRVGSCPIHNKRVNKDDDSIYNCKCAVIYNDAEGYKKLLNKIIEERITGKESESKWNGNQFTERGHELESEAIESYELETFNKVHRIGLIELDEWTVCSPDGLIGEDDLIQIKNPIFSTHIEYLEAKKVPDIYYPQLQFELLVSGRKRNIFYSYHPNLPALNISVERNDKYINDIKLKLKDSINKVEQRIKCLKLASK